MSQSEKFKLGAVQVGTLATLTNDEYPGLGECFVQIREKLDLDSVLCRVYGSSPHEAMQRAINIASIINTYESGGFVGAEEHKALLDQLEAVGAGGVSGQRVMQALNGTSLDDIKEAGIYECSSAKGNSPNLSLNWSDPSPPKENGIRYDHVTLETPVGLFSIEWKSWKKYDPCCIYLDGDFKETKDTLDDAKEWVRTYLSDLSREMLVYTAKEQPDQALLISMAMCLNHGFGLLDKGAQVLILSDMRKLWAEVVGLGYYQPENRGMYLDMLASDDRIPDASKTVSQDADPCIDACQEWRNDREPCPDGGPCKFDGNCKHLEGLKLALKEINDLRNQLELTRAHVKGEVWVWEQNGNNDLSSMGLSMAVLVSAGTLRELLNNAKANTSNISIPDEILLMAKRIAADKFGHCTSDPIFTVQKRRILSGFDTDYIDEIGWFYDCEQVEATLSAALEVAYQENGNIPEGYTRTGIQEVWEHYATYVTMEAAQEFVDKKGENSRVYVDSGYRNSEWKALRSFLLQIATNETHKEQQA